MIKTKNNSLQNPVSIILIALLCCALWGSATPAIQEGYKFILPLYPTESGDMKPDVPSIMLFAGTRFLLAGLLTVLIYSIARRRFLYPKLHNMGRVAATSLFQTVIQYIFFYIGLANTTGVKGTIASGTSTFFALLVSALIFKQEKLTAKKITACVLGFAGIIVINLNGLTFGMNLLGDGFVIFSAISAGISSVLIKRFSKHEDPVTISGYQFMMGGAVMIITGLIFGGRFQLKDFRGIVILIYLAFLSAIAYSLWGLLLKHNPVSKITVFNFSTPVFGTMFSLIMLENQNVNPVNLIITLILISLGIFLLNYARPVPRAPEISEAALDRGETVAAENDTDARAVPSTESNAEPSAESGTENGSGRE